MGFTAASLRPELARTIAERYLSTNDWMQTRSSVLSTNALQNRATASAERQEREIRQRLQRLTPQQIALLASGNAEDRAALSWLAAAKQIQFAFNFASITLTEKLAEYDTLLRYADFQSFLDSEALSHPQLSNLAPSSIAKLRQVLLRMLKEVGIISEIHPNSGLGKIHRPILSNSVLNVIDSDNARWLAAFLLCPRNNESA